MFVSRSVKIDENDSWDWEKMSAGTSRKPTNLEKLPQDQFANPEEDDSNDEDYAVRGTRTLEDIYNRCNLALLEPADIFTTTLQKGRFELLRERRGVINSTSIKGEC